MSRSPQPVRLALGYPYLSSSRDSSMAESQFRRHRSSRVDDQYSSTRPCKCKDAERCRCPWKISSTCQSYKDAERCRCPWKISSTYGGRSYHGSFMISSGGGLPSFSPREGVSPTSGSTKTTLSELAEGSKNATPDGEDCAKSESAATIAYHQTTNGTAVARTEQSLTPKELHFPKMRGQHLAETVQQGPAPPPLEGWNTGSVEDSANTSVENRIPHSQEVARSNSYSIAVHEAEHSHIEIPSPLPNSYPLHATGTNTSSTLVLQIEPLRTSLHATSSLVQHRDDSAAKFIRRYRRKIRPCYILIALGVLTIVGSLTPALWRSIDRDDLSGGFTLAQYILGVGVFVVGPMVAIHSKTCTCWQ